MGIWDVGLVWPCGGYINSMGIWDVGLVWPCGGCSTDMAKSKKTLFEISKSENTSGKNCNQLHAIKKEKEKEKEKVKSSQVNILIFDSYLLELCK